MFFASDARQDRSDCSGMKDSWGADFLERYGDNLTSHDASVELLCVMLLALCDQAPIEATHASLRRWLHGLSVQTHTPRHELISACRLIQGFRRRLKVTRPGGQRKQPVQHPPDSDLGPPPPKAKVRRTGVGGVQRAFFSEQLSAGHTMEEAHAELRRIRVEDPERLAKLKEKGNDATAR
eukprot:7382267-Pyramimonas_sp.AAC.1